MPRLGREGARNNSHVSKADKIVNIFSMGYLYSDDIKSGQLLTRYGGDHLACMKEHKNNWISLCVFGEIRPDLNEAETRRPAHEDQCLLRLRPWVPSK